MAFVLTALGIKITDALIRHALHTVAAKESSNFDLAFAPLVNRFVNILVAVIAVIVVLTAAVLSVATAQPRNTPSSKPST